MAEQAPDQRPPHRATPGMEEAEKSAAPTDARGSAWSRGQEYPNPPEKGWLKRPQYPHPPDPINPDPATLREQWLYVSRRYSRWYSRAWGAAGLAGAAVFAAGWAVKGANPFPSHQAGHRDEPPHDGAAKEP
jgi:hypothetical protein